MQLNTLSYTLLKKNEKKEKKVILRKEKKKDKTLIEFSLAYIITQREKKLI